MHRKLRWAIYGILCIITILLAVRLAIIHKRDLNELWIKYQLRNEHIVISLTTTPHRIEYIQESMQNLFNQTAPIKKIYINIPYVFKRDDLKYNIPQWLADDNRVTILRTKDYGPGTKVLGVLEKGDLPKNAIIISVDDDMKYPLNLALHLAYKSKLNPKSAIGIAGVNIDEQTSELINILEDDVYVNILQGVGGVAYRRYFFDDDIFEIEHAPQACIDSDDLYISYYLAQKEILRQMIYNDYINKNNLLTPDLGENQDALHILYSSEAARHRECMTYLQQKIPGVQF